VFLRVTSNHSEEVREMHLNDDVDDLLRQHSAAHSINDSVPEGTTHVQINQQHYLDVSTSYPFRALFRKNFSLQKRQTFTNLCQILTPVLVMAILVLLQLIIRAQLGDNFNKRELVPSMPFPLNEHGLKFPFIPNEAIFMQYKETKHMQHVFDLQNEEIPQDANNTSASTCLTYFLLSRDSEAMNHSIGYATEDGMRAGLLGHIKQRACQLYNATTVQVPFFDSRGSYDDIQSELFGDIVTLNNNSLTDVQQPPLLYLLPDGYVSFHELNVTNAQYARLSRVYISILIASQTKIHDGSQRQHSVQISSCQQLHASRPTCKSDVQHPWLIPRFDRSDFDRKRRSNATLVTHQRSVCGTS